MSPVVFGMVTTDRGDVVELLDAAGNPFAAYRYDAWGNPQGSGNVGTGIWSQTTSLISVSQVASDIAGRQVLRYASYCYDSESGLYYLSARSYDPETRQFLSKDEAKADGEESEFQYCGGNPIERKDQTGKGWTHIWKQVQVRLDDGLEYAYVHVSWDWNGTFIWKLKYDLASDHPLYVYCYKHMATAYYYRPVAWGRYTQYKTWGGTADFDFIDLQDDNSSDHNGVHIEMVAGSNKLSATHTVIDMRSGHSKEPVDTLSSFLNDLFNAFRD